MATSEKGEPISIKVSDSIIIIDSTSAKVIINIFADLGKHAEGAFKSGHYLESSIIMFQLVEYFLRLIIEIWAGQKGSSKDILTKLKREQSFYRLVIFLGLVKPDNGISERLFKFNTKRNEIVHRLFKFKSIESLKDDLIVFHQESLDLFEGLKSLIPST